MAFQNKRPGGYGFVGACFAGEVDTITCAHCMRVVFLNADRDLNPEVIKTKPEFKDMGGFCRSCMKPICGPCCDKDICTPTEMLLQKIEKKVEQSRWLSEIMEGL